MVFLIQQSQNKGAVAVDLKLNELLVLHKEARNMLISSEERARQCAGPSGDGPVAQLCRSRPPVRTTLEKGGAFRGQ